MVSLRLASVLACLVLVVVVGLSRSEVGTAAYPGPNVLYLPLVVRAGGAPPPTATRTPRPPATVTPSATPTRSPTAVTHNLTASIAVGHFPTVSRSLQLTQLISVLVMDNYHSVAGCPVTLYLEWPDVLVTGYYQRDEWAIWTNAEGFALANLFLFGYPWTYTDPYYTYAVASCVGQTAWTDTVQFYVLP